MVSAHSDLDDAGEIVTPTPRVKRILSSPRCFPHIAQVIVGTVPLLTSCVGEYWCCDLHIFLFGRPSPERFLGENNMMKIGKISVVILRFQLLNKFKYYIISIFSFGGVGGGDRPFFLGNQVLLRQLLHCLRPLLPGIQKL